MQEQIQLTRALAEPLSQLQQTARRIAETSQECKLELDPEEYVESFKPFSMDITYHWSKVNLHTHTYTHENALVHACTWACPPALSDCVSYCADISASWSATTSLIRSLQKMWFCVPSHSHMPGRDVQKLNKNVEEECLLSSAVQQRLVGSCRTCAATCFVTDVVAVIPGLKLRGDLCHD